MKHLEIKQLISFSARTEIFFWACAWLIVLLVLGTLAQKTAGLYMAQEVYFSSWIFWLGGFIPTPGTMLTLAVITVNLAARIWIDQWSWSKSGIFLVHLGALLLLVGGFITAQFSEESALVLTEWQTSNSVRDYFDLEIIGQQDGKTTFKITPDQVKAGQNVEINGQSATLQILELAQNAKPVMNGEKVDMQALPRDPEEEANLSAVRIRIGEQEKVLFEEIPMNKDFMIGDEAYQIFLRHERRALPFAIELKDFVRDVYPGTDQPSRYYSDVVVHDGDVNWQSRISMNEPLRYKGYTFYQASFIQQGDMQTSVLATVKNAGRVFPYVASIVMALGILIHLFVRVPVLMKRAVMVGFVMLMAAQAGPAHAAAEQQRFDTSYFARLPVLHDGRLQPIDTFARGYMKQLAGRDEIGKLSANDWLSAVIFAPDIARGLAVFKIQNPDVASSIGLEWEGSKRLYSFDEVREAMRAHKDMIQDLENAEPKNMTPAQRQLLELQQDMLIYIDLSHSLAVYMPERDNSFPASLFRVIPPQWAADGDEWKSPWMVTSSGGGSPEAAEILKHWAAMAVSYRTLDFDAWAAQSEALYAVMAPHAPQQRLDIETIYNQLHPHQMSLAFYVIALLILSGLILGWKRWAYRGAWVSIAIGAAIHMLAIAARIYVLGRPPVSTLYESVIFVGLIVVMLSLLFEGRSRNGLGLIIGGSIGAILHFIGLNYADNGTTMQVLMPVLNTNFWLATHVLTISIGYGVCLFTGVLAHLYLLQKWRGKEASSLMRSSMAFGLIALLFTVTGTILGGIWADQSWGRFWGWDPKENGAMLICLWLILILHGRVAGILKPMAFIIGMAFLPCVVAVAWFGVNLLSVGLHSYGFTQGIALNLAAFIILETVIIAGLSSLIWQKNKQKKARNQQS